MKGRTIVLDHLGEVEAAALMVDGKLDDLLVDNPARAGALVCALMHAYAKGRREPQARSSCYQEP